MGVFSWPVVLLALVVWLISLPVQAASAPDCLPRILSMTSAEAHGSGGVRPASGWQPVTLPDIRKRPWSDLRGEVWYRIDWERGCAPGAAGPPLALRVDGLVIAGEIHLNDHFLWRDASLVEPLSLSWLMPRWWPLPDALLRDGVNTIWVRVLAPEGLAQGLGTLQLGAADSIEASHLQRTWVQRTVLFLTIGLSSAMGLICLTIWCLRRAERAFGWYALMTFCWGLYLFTTLALTPWPFETALAHTRLNHASYLLYVACFCLFTWRFGGQRLPRLERWLGLVTALGLAVALFAPYPLVESTWLGAVLIFLANCLQFQFHAWRTRKPMHLLLALCYLAFLVTGIHDAYVLTHGTQEQNIWTTLTGPLAALFIGVLMGTQLVASIRRAEYFNRELQDHVTQARAELSEVLRREHQYALNHAKLQERMHLVHDLHDGLGGSLVRNMALVEQSPTPLSNERMLSLLKVLRDDLRQVIDHGSSAGAVTPATPVQWAAPLRHRFTRLFDELDVDSSWRIAEHWRIPPSTLQCLGLMRIAEEALANVIKHSRARHVQVQCVQPQADLLQLDITDDGCGFDPEAVRHAGLSVGMRSMAARAERLGGSLSVTSGPGSTTVRVTLRVELSA